MSRPRRRRFAIALLLLAAALAAIWLGLHTAPVRGRALDWALLQISGERFHVEVGAVEYRLHRLWFRLEDVSVAAAGHEDAPFFTARALVVDLPWSVLSGTIAVEELLLVSPDVAIRMAEDGTNNLPSGGEPYHEPLPIGRLEVRQMSIRWHQPNAGLRFDADGLDALLEPGRGGIAGPVGLERPATLQVGEHRWPVAIEGRGTWDGSDLGMQPLEAESELADLRLRGTVGPVLAAPELDLEAGLRARLDELGAELGMPLSGAVDLEARLRGPATGPEGTLTGSSEGLGWHELQTGPLTLAAEIGPESVTIHELSTALGDTALEITGELSMTEGAQSRAEIVWARLDPAWLTDLAGRDLSPLSATSVTGAATLRWPGLDWRRAILEAHADAEPRSTAGGPVALDGRVELSADAAGGSWQLDADLHGTDGSRWTARASGAMELDAPMDGTLQGDLGVDVPDMAPWSDLATRLMDTSATPRRLTGALHLSGGLGGSLGEPSFDGELRTTAVGLEGLDLPPVDGRTRLRLGPEGLAVSELLMTAGANRLGGGLSVGRPDGTLAADLTLDLSDPSSLSASWLARAGLTADDLGGRLEGHLRLRGTTSRPTGEISLSGDALRVRDWGPASLELEASLQPPPGAAAPGAVRLLVDTARLQAHGDSIAASGEFDLGAGTTRSTLRIDVGDLGPWAALAPALGRTAPAELSGAAHGTLEIDGAVNSPRIEGELRLESLRVAGTGPVTLQARLSADDTATVAQLSLSTSDLRVGHRPVPDVEARGDVRLVLSPAPEVAIGLQSLHVGLDPQPLTLTAPTRLTYEAETLRVEEMRLGVGGSRLRLAGQFGTPAAAGLEIELDTRLSDLEEILLPFLDPVAGVSEPAPDEAATAGRHASVDGDLRVRAVLRGTPAAPRIDGDASLGEGRLELTGLPPVTDIDLRVRGDGEVIRLERGEAAWQGTRLSARGQFPLALLRSPGAATSPARLSARLGPLSVESLREFLPEGLGEDAEGQVTLRAELEADTLKLEALRGEIVADTLELHLAGQTLRQEAPTRLEITGGRVRVREWRWMQSGNGSPSRIGVTGDAGLGPGETVDLHVGGELRLRWLSAFLTGAAVDGAADLDARVGGTLDRPTLDGHFRVRDGRYAQSEPRIAVSELSGEVRFEGERIVAEALEGRVNGGRLMISGDLRLDAAGEPRGLLGVTVRNAAVALDQVRAETDVDLSLSVQGLRDTRMFGSVTLLRGAYRSDRPVTEELLQLLRREAVVDEEPSPLDEMRLEVRVRSAENLRVDSSLAALALSMDVQVVGTLGAPAVLGRVTLLEGGEVYLGSNIYTVERGAIDFSDPSAIEPMLDISAQTRVGTTTITLAISGRAEEPRVDVSSDPPYDRGDIYSLLATGRTLREAGGSETAVLREQALGVLASQFLGSAGQAVGLDAVRIERAAPVQRYRPDPDLLSDDTDLASRLTLRKAITSDFTLIFSQNLGNEEQRTWVGRYSLPWNLTFQGVKFDDDTRSAALRHRLTLGGPERDEARREQRVEQVRLQGELALPESELRDRLRIGAGDRFDFWRWQEDVDRLRDLYRDRGLLEASVSASREALDDGDATAAERLTLIYEIDAGPETRLVVEGHDLPGDVRERVEETWSESILREFLVDDVRAVIREHLAEEGYLRAEIDVGLVDEGGSDEEEGDRTPPAARTLRIEIVPGPRTRERSLTFDGNELVDDGTLRTALERREIIDQAWVRPERVESALQRVYAERGMPEAEVSVGEPEFRGERARRTVTVREGPVHRIERVRLEGNEALSREELEAGLSIATEGPWSGERLMATRRAVADAYRAHGFNSVDVEARTLVEEGVRLLHLRVTEGPREILSEVTVEGAEVTRRSVIDRNITLQTGEPLVMAEVYRTRQQLYDVGVFRSVRVEVQATGPDDADERPVKVTFQVVEEPRFSIETGLEVLDEDIGADTRERKPGLSLSIVHDNFLGRAVSLGATGRLRKDQQVARFYASTPRLFGLPLASTVSLSRFHELIGPPDDLFRIDRTVTQLTAEQRVPLFEEWSLSYSGNWQRNETFFPNQDPDDPFSFEGDSIDLVRLNTSLIRDTRDDQFAPGGGMFHASTFEWSTPLLGSDEKFTKYLAHQYYFWTPARGVVLASALRFGSANAFGSELIPFERFRAGGSTSVRGYPDGRLGSIDLSGGAALGGNAMLVFNQEVRFPLWRWFRGVAFVDAGSTFASLAEIRASELFYSTGVGLRAHTPLLLLRLDAGMRLSDFEDEPRFRLHFGIGHVF